MSDDESNGTLPPGLMPEDEIDETLEETFPASDPPSWTTGVEPHHPRGEDSGERKNENPQNLPRN